MSSQSLQFLLCYGHHRSNVHQSAAPNKSGLFVKLKSAPNLFMTNSWQWIQTLSTIQFENKFVWRAVLCVPLQRDVIARFSQIMFNYAQMFAKVAYSKGDLKGLFTNFEYITELFYRDGPLIKNVSSVEIRKKCYISKIQQFF